MLVRVFGATLDGISGVAVGVEVDAGRGLPAFQIVGQGDRVVNESRDRIRAAFRQCGLEFPPGRVTVNLAPSGIPKSGTSLDLAIAVAIAGTRLELDADALASTLFVGELGLDGALHAVRGTLALLDAARSPPRAGLQQAVVPLASLNEASVFPDLSVHGADALGSVIDFLRDATALVRCASDTPSADAADAATEPDLAEVRGQEAAKRALEIAAAGGHNLLFVGPPGSGKTLLARRLPALLPDLDFDAALEATRVHSVAGLLRGGGLLRRPPFRAPHHTTSDAGMAGGGRPLRPGEISLAHHGVLFLDELPEFRRPVLEALRQPIEEGEIRIVRAHGVVRLPTRFQLVAAMNPCKCGWRGDPTHDCVCGDPDVARYRAKLSGPLLDRIDLHVAVAPVPWKEMTDDVTRGETSACVRERVLQARERQLIRYKDEPFDMNAALPERALRKHCPLDADGRALLERAVHTLGLSMRAYVRIHRLTRTIADLEGTDEIRGAHVAEAVSYREPDRSQPT